MAKVVMGIGLPGSGKSTLLKEFASKNSYVYISPDQIRQELTGSEANQQQNGEIWKLAHARIREVLSEGKDVVFDATFTDESRRQEFISFCRDSGAEKIQGFYFDVPSEVAKERNINRPRVVPKHTMERMEGELRQNPPRLYDGFDSIFRLDENHNLLEAEKFAFNENEILHKKFR